MAEELARHVEEESPLVLLGPDQTALYQLLHVAVRLVPPDPDEIGLGDRLVVRDDGEGPEDGTGDVLLGGKMGDPVDVGVLHAERRPLLRAVELDTPLWIPVDLGEVVEKAVDVDELHPAEELRQPAARQRVGGEEEGRLDEGEVVPAIGSAPPV